MIQHRHQLFTFCPGYIFVEEVKLGNALAEKVARHNAALLISLTFLPDFVQTRNDGINDVMVARWVAYSAYPDTDIIASRFSY